MKYFESLFTHSADGVVISRPGGEIVRANPAACAALGRSEAELQRLGRTAFVVESAELQRLTDVRDRGEVVKGELEFRRADGTTFPVEVTSAAIPDAGEPLIYAIFRDVSARKAAERELQLSAARFRDFFDSLQESVALLAPERDAAGRIVTWRFVEVNAAMRASSTVLEVRGRTLHELAAPVADERTRLFESVLRTGRPAEYQTVFDARRYIGRAFKQSDDLIGLSLLNVTERALAEEALQASRRQAEEQAAELRAVLDTVPAAVWIARDRMGDRIDANRFGAELLRNPHGGNVSVTAPDEAERPRHFTPMRNGVALTADELPIQAAARFGSAPRNVELDLAFDDGTVRYLLGSAEPLRDGAGEIRGSVGAFIDITDRRRSENALGEALARFNAFMATTPAIAWIKDDLGRIVYVNASWEKAFGRPTEAAIGMREVDLRSGELRNQIEERDAQVLATGEHQSAPERHEGSSGSERWWQTTRFLITMPSGARMIGCVASDVTSQRRAEETLRSSESRAREAQRELEHALEVTRRTEEKFRQSQKMEAVGRLAGGVAHDFNNLLTVILGNSEFLTQKLRNDPLQAEVQEIINAGRRAANLTRQLLAFSRKQVLEPRIINLNGVLRGMQTMLGRLLGEDIEISLQLHPNPYLCFVDAGQIEQVLLNLAVNARDAMLDGGRLMIETANVSLDDEYVQAHPDATAGPHLMISVSDSGSGMSRDIQSHLFEPFFTTKPQGKGTGLGLSTVYGIVKQSGGTIWVYSEVGQGTTFKVYLPRAIGSEQPAVVAPLMPGQYTGHESILLAEDDAQVRTTVSAMLRRAGYGVIEASNGGEALLICEQHGDTIELLLTDVVMPKMNGRQLAERLRAVRPELRVLFMSGYTENVVVHHGVVDSGVDFLQKPLTAETLLPKVREVLDRPVEGKQTR
jgi:two-component system, cell cycle sensor histidine kinase and response regulator CckA